MEAKNFDNAIEHLCAALDFFVNATDDDRRDSLSADEYGQAIKKAVADNGNEIEFNEFLCWFDSDE